MAAVASEDELDSGSGSGSSPFGRCSSSQVTFSGAFEALDLTPPQEANEPTKVEEDDAATGAGAPGHPHQQRELGDDAVWTLSSAKVGNAVEQLRDQDPNTFWQSVERRGDADSMRDMQAWGSEERAASH